MLAEGLFFLLVTVWNIWLLQWHQRFEEWEIVNKVRFLLRSLQSIDWSLDQVRCFV
jgi:hypothetical protein